MARNMTMSIRMDWLAYRNVFDRTVEVWVAAKNLLLCYFLMTSKGNLNDMSSRELRKVLTSGLSLAAVLWKNINWRNSMLKYVDDI